jgi:hypothetical protein
MSQAAPRAPSPSAPPPIGHRGTAAHNHRSNRRRHRIWSGRGVDEVSRPPSYPRPPPHSILRSPHVFHPPSSVRSNLLELPTLPLTAGHRQGGTRPDPPPAHLRCPEQHEKGPAAATLHHPSPSSRCGRKRGRGGWRVEPRHHLP